MWDRVTHLEMQCQCGVKYGKDEAPAVLDKKIYINLQNYKQGNRKAPLAGASQVKMIKYDSFTNGNVFLSI